MKCQIEVTTFNFESEKINQERVRTPSKENLRPWNGGEEIYLICHSQAQKTFFAANN